MTSPILFAHRGGNNKHPDNTTESFQHALAAGATGLESDVRLSADGVVMLQHDNWIIRNFRFGRIERRPSAWMQQRRVLTVAEFAEQFLLPEPAAPVSVDVKASGAGAEMIRVVRDLAPDALSSLYLCTDSISRIDALRELDDRPQLVHSAEAKAFSRPLIEHVQWLGTHDIPVCNVPVEDWSVDSGTAAHESGVRVFSSLINQPARMRRALSLGVDGVYTDKVGEMVSLLKAQST